LVIFLIPLLVFINACSSVDLAKKEDYNASIQYFRESDYMSAKSQFPKKENNGFITNSEKLYLDFISGDPNPSLLLKQAEELDLRQVIFLSEEAKKFFYKETQDGYYPAEHEVIFFHLLMAYSFAKQNQKEPACVETRRASEYLEGSFDGSREKFDSGGLRLLLASLWIYCDEWEHAKVDLRVAGKLLNNKSLKKLSETDLPPKNVYLSLLGDGPDVEWNGELNKVSFMNETYDNSKLFIGDDHFEQPFQASSTSSSWYQRHQERDKKIRKILSESKYMTKAIGATTEAIVHKTTTAVASGATIVGGFVLGAVIVGGSIYLIIQAGSACGSNCGEIFVFLMSAGWLAGEKIVNFGKKLFVKENKKADENLKEVLDISKTYRFVRFLPERIDFAYSNENLNVLEKNLGLTNNKKAFLTLDNGSSKIHLYQWTP
jgi:hypothetical protein